MPLKDKAKQAEYCKKWAESKRNHLNAYQRKYHKKRKGWKPNRYRGEKWQRRVDEGIEVYKIVRFYAAKNRHDRLSIFKKKMIQFHIDYKIFKELDTKETGRVSSPSL